MLEQRGQVFTISDIVSYVFLGALVIGTRKKLQHSDVFYFDDNVFQFLRIRQVDEDPR